MAQKSSTSKLIERKKRGKSGIALFKWMSKNTICSQSLQFVLENESTDIKYLSLLFGLNMHHTLRKYPMVITPMTNRVKPIPILLLSKCQNKLPIILLL